MNSLLNNLRSTALGNQFKPAILQCFGDIAQAIGGEFETYLSVVAQVLQQAAGISVQSENTNNFEMLDYVVSLREGIMDAWGGIVLAIKVSTVVRRSMEDRNALLMPWQRTCCSHTSNPSSSSCRRCTQIRIAQRLSCALRWALLGKIYNILERSDNLLIDITVTSLKPSQTANTATTSATTG